MHDYLILGGGSSGCVLAARLSQELGQLSARDADRIEALLQSIGLPVALPDIAPEVMLEHMGRDKKNDGGALRLILLKAIGEAYAVIVAAICRRTHDHAHRAGRVDSAAIRALHLLERHDLRADRVNEV